MSIAPRETKCLSSCQARAGQSRSLEQSSYEQAVGLQPGAPGPFGEKQRPFVPAVQSLSVRQALVP